ncbi:protein kinase [Streptomyces sp. XH2]|uniref:protein kinase n=1 Tax=Streptomyces sp. XH2 TaxID=3412483 RepID=UPI003C7EB1CB
MSRALAAAAAAAQVPDHPRLDQVFHVFAEGGSLWVVSELVPARPLAALLAERPLSPHRAAEVAADVLTALRALHAHGWTHRNITTRTVLICDDGRAVLTGLAAGAAEEALCGYNPVPEGADPPGGGNGGMGAGAGAGGSARGGMPSRQRAARGAAGLPGTPGMPGQPGGSVPGGATGGGRMPVGGRAPGGAPRGAGGGRPGPGPGLGPGSGLRTGPGSGLGEGVAPRGGVPGGSAPGGSSPGGPAAPRPGGQEGRPSPSPYRDQGAAGGFLPPGGPRSSGEPWPPLNSRPPAGGQGTGRSGRGQPGGQGAGPGAGQPGSQAGPRQVRSSAVAAYRAGAARAAAARAAGENAPPVTPTGSSTWGGGSAASGAAPTPAPDSPHGASSGRNRPPGPPGARSGPAGPGNAARPDVPEVKLPGSAASWPAFPGMTAPPRSAAPAVPSGTRPGAGNGAVHGAGNAAPPSPPPPHASQSPAKSPEGSPENSPSATAPGSESAGKPPAAWGAAGQQPAGALAVERARQARMVVVGAVTERWAPEQAWPVQESWQLAPPVGPAADLWALGALLFRVVQGHAPYPEDSTAELVRLVCVEPPAFAEECGALRPVVESLMRKDPAERPEFEELRGWLRSLIRSAPEPEPGGRTLTVPDTAPDAPADQHRLPVVRRKGELVRRRRGRPITAVDTAPAAHGRHKKTAKDPARDTAKANANAPAPRSGTPRTGHLQEQRGRPARSAFGLGRLLLGLVLLLLIGAALYAMLFMPRAEDSASRARADRAGSAGARSAAPRAPETAATPGGTRAAGGTDASGGATAEERIAESDGAAKGFTLRKDPKGFTVAVAKDWQRRGANDRGQVVYAGGEYQLVVVPGRDEVAEFGSDPMAYQQSKEPELESYRSSSWSGASGLRRIDVGGTASAEGTFNWNDSSGRQVYVRNSATIVNGRYHLLQVIGPMNEQRSVDRFFEQAAATYRAGG